MFPVVINKINAADSESAAIVRDKVELIFSLFLNLDISSKPDSEVLFFLCYLDKVKVLYVALFKRL